MEEVKANNYGKNGCHLPTIDSSHAAMFDMAANNHLCPYTTSLPLFLPLGAFPKTS